MRFPKLILSGFLILTTLFAHSGTSDLPLVRKAFYEAKVSENTATKWHKTLNKKANLSPLEYAYMGAFECFLGKHAWSPIEKYRRVSDGLFQINQAVNRDGTDVEIRFIRYTIENEIPRILELSHHLKEDRLILKEYTKQNPQEELTIRINSYFEASS